MPDIENRRRKKCRVGPGQSAGKQPKNSRKNSRNSQSSLISGVSVVLPFLFWAVFTVTRSAPFSAVFNVRHLAPL